MATVMLRPNMKMSKEMPAIYKSSYQSSYQVSMPVFRALNTTTCASTAQRNSKTWLAGRANKYFKSCIIVIEHIFSSKFSAAVYCSDNNGMYTIARLALLWQNSFMLTVFMIASRKINELPTKTPLKSFRGPVTV